MSTNHEHTRKRTAIQRCQDTLIAAERARLDNEIWDKAQADRQRRKEAKR